MSNEAEKPNFITTSLDFLVNWGRTNSLWPFPYGTACCAIEFMSTEVGRYDLSRIGSEYVRFTPRQSDVLLVAGTISYKQAPILKRMYEQMAEQYVGSQYGKQIDALNQRWREALEAGDTEAMGNIRKAIEGLYKTMADDEQIRQFAQNIKDATAEADTTFSDLTSAWVSSLMDFNATAEDWAKELGKMIAQKIIETTVVGQMLQPLLDNLQNAVSGALTAYGDDYKAMMGDQGIAGAMQSITDAYPQLKETVEQIMNAFGLFADPAENPFKDLQSTFISSLTDMEATAEDFGKQIGQTLINQMIQAIIEKKGFQSQIEALGDDWALALSDTYTVTVSPTDSVFILRRIDPIYIS